MAAAGGGVSPSTITLTLLLLLAILSHLSLTCFATASATVGSNRGLLAATESHKQQQKSNNQIKQISNCNDVVNQSHCNSNPKCRWCRSNSLDDMCTSKPEAWRLPSQVFTCD